MTWIPCCHFPDLHCLSQQLKGLQNWGPGLNHRQYASLWPWLGLQASVLWAFLVLNQAYWAFWILFACIPSFSWQLVPHLRYLWFWVHLSWVTTSKPLPCCFTATAVKDPSWFPSSFFHSTSFLLFIPEHDLYLWPKKWNICLYKFYPNLILCMLSLDWIQSSIYFKLALCWIRALVDLVNFPIFIFTVVYRG